MEHFVFFALYTFVFLFINSKQQVSGIRSRYQRRGRDGISQCSHEPINRAVIQFWVKSPSLPPARNERRQIKPRPKTPLVTSTYRTYTPHRRLTVSAIVSEYGGKHTGIQPCHSKVTTIRDKPNERRSSPRGTEICNRIHTGMGTGMGKLASFPTWL